MSLRAKNQKRISTLRTAGLLWGALGLLGGVVGCQSGQGAPAATAATQNNTTTPVSITEKSGTSTGSAESAKKGVERPVFDGERAFAILKKQCAFGPRPLGTDAHEKTKDYLLAEMKKYADKTITQEFSYRGMPVTNIIGVFYPAGTKEPSTAPLLLTAHWDTRPVADGPNSDEIRRGQLFRYGPKGWNHTSPMIAANDGASGVAVLLELARIFKEKKPAAGVLLFLNDGEDYGDFEANNREGDGVLLGATYFAKHFKEEKAFGQPLYGILLDMVGAKNLILPREASSHQFAPQVNEKVFGIAKSLGYGDVFRFNENQEVEDDHTPLNKAGIPCIDLIHPLPYGEYGQTGYTHWHTLQDTVDKCSAKSLKIVGETVAEVLYRETP